MEKQEEEEEGGSIVWPVKGWGLRLYADVLLATDICSSPPPRGHCHNRHGELKEWSLPAKRKGFL